MSSIPCLSVASIVLKLEHRDNPNFPPFQSGALNELILCMFYMLLSKFFEPNPIETFSEFQEMISMEQVDMLIKDKDVFIMQVVKQFIIHDTHVYSSIFLAESNGNIFIILGNDLHEAGGHVDQGKGHVHHVAQRNPS